MGHGRHSGLKGLMIKRLTQTLNVQEYTIDARSFWGRGGWREEGIPEFGQQENGSNLLIRDDGCKEKGRFPHSWSKYKTVR